jgi:hypothetical protein
MGSPLLARQAILLVRPLRDLLPLELGQGDHDGGHDPPRGRGGVDLLFETDELDVVPLEFLDEGQEVHDVARDAVDLREDDDVHEARTDLLHELRKTGQVLPIFRASGYLSLPTGST